MKTLILSLIFLVVGFLILLHQYVFYGVWFEVDQLHHETFALTSFALALGIIIGKKGEE